MYIDETFVLASGWDEAKKSHRGLELTDGGTAPVMENGTLLVTSAPVRQQQAERAGTPPSQPPSSSGSTCSRGIVMAGERDGED